MTSDVASTTPPDAGLLFLEGLVTVFRYHHDLADRAIAQTTDRDLYRPLDPNTNSIAVTMRHVAGNLRSRWTDFLTSDGEKPWRDRDQEFDDPPVQSREALLADWASGWTVLYATLAGLTSADVVRDVMIRGERLSVPLAAQRSLAHISYHVGQIVTIARIHAGDAWTTLTIPRGGTREHNEQIWGQTQYAGGSSRVAAGQADLSEALPDQTASCTVRQGSDAAITPAVAWAFAREWIDAWNARDLDRVLRHDCDDFTFTSPLASSMGYGAGGVLTGKSAVRPYWEEALQRNPALQLKLLDVLISVGGLTILYESIGGRRCVEVLRFQVGRSQVAEAAAYYATTPEG